MLVECCCYLAFGAMTSSIESLTWRVHALEAQDFDQRVHAIECRLHALEERSTRMFSWIETIINHLVTHVIKLSRLLQQFKYHAGRLGTWLVSQEEAETPEFQDEHHFEGWKDRMYRALA